VKRYGQFCPVARAAEVLTERWTPLVVRELLLGSRQFNDLRRGVPLMSPTLLSQRLKTLQDAGIVERLRGEDGVFEYHLTQAGRELKAIIEMIGTWGHRWLEPDLTKDELDPALLMWDMHRRIHIGRLPARRVVVRFEFASAPAAKRRWWLVIDGQAVDLCLKNPGFAVDLTVQTDVRTLTLVWLGHQPLESAVQARKLVIDGPAELKRELGSWLMLSIFAGVDRTVPIGAG
jgi:DNA-binding HxlR family transcriptional regulator